MNTTIILIILLYVLSVFITRYLNYLIYKLDYFKPIPIVWFIPIGGLFAYLYILIVILIGKIENKPNWFTGKHW